MSTNIILCGVGGQGTILASRLIAAAALRSGIQIRTAETIGMAQRGGSVFSHIRLGDGAASPLIARGTADLIIGFEPGETVRQLPFLLRDQMGDKWMYVSKSKRIPLPGELVKDDKPDLSAIKAWHDRIVRMNPELKGVTFEMIKKAFTDFS